MKRLNILNLGPTPPRTGGSAFVNIETLIALAERGHNVSCIAEISGSDLKNPDYNRSWRNTGVKVYPVEGEFFHPSKPLDDEQFNTKREKILDKFHELVDSHKPDVFMVGHEMFSYFANAEARKMGIPVVQVLHGTPTHMIDEEVYSPEMKRRFLDSVGEATLVVGVSNYLANIVRKYGILQTTYIHNGTDTTHFKPKESKNEEFLSSLGLELRDKVVLHCSTLGPVKRPMDIVESAPLALKEDPTLRYVIVGEGKLRAQMEERAKDLGVHDYFRFVGAIDYQNIPPFFQNADMFLLPSEHEGFGRVLREAQACKVSPVASDIEPIREVIENRRTGCLFKKGNLRSLVDNLIELAHDLSYRKRISNMAYGVAVKYNLINMTNEYESALTDPLGFLEIVR